VSNKPIMSNTPLDQLAAHAGVRRFAEMLGLRQRVVATGAVGSSTAFVAGAIAVLARRPVVLVVAHLDDADEATEELGSAGVEVRKVPALEATPGESALAAESLAARVRLAGQLPALAADAPMVIVAPIAALMQLVPPLAQAAQLVRELRPGARIPLAELVRWLVEHGYKRIEGSGAGAATIESAGDFSVRGGIVDIYPSVAADVHQPLGEPIPIRIEFFGDEIERIREVDLETLASDRVLERVELVAHNLVEKTRQGRVGSGVQVLELIPAGAIALIAETMEVVEQGRGYFERVSDGHGLVGPPAVLKVLEQRFHALGEVNQFSAGASASDGRVDLDLESLPIFSKDVGQACGELGELARRAGQRVLVCCLNAGEAQRCKELLAEHAPDLGERVAVCERYVHRGFIARDGHARGEGEGGGTISCAIVPYHELLSRFSVRRSARTVRHARAMDTFLDFEEGDAVVHADHGIARFVGLTMMSPRELPTAQRKLGIKTQAEPEEHLVLEFAAKSKLYVPALQIDKVQKYVGGFSGKPQLSVLGGQKWQTQKERVAESVKDLAAELLRVRAAREHLPGVAYPGDTAWQREFEEEFPYEETPDQLAAIQEIKRDMQRARPMDRLLCGDVGFGKTELAIRAAFKACEFGKQVAVLVPTTVLAEQHERTFKSRFAGYPFRVESVSRFKSDADVLRVLEELGKGRVDLIIGTHRLLSKDVHFADLGLVVVDEEQRFGVEHKEALLRLRLTVDVLTLSATPIPRTLHMSMLGIRDISSLTTPPADRRAIVTEVIPYNTRRVQQALERELAREGQVYVVHNRVHDIRSVADEIYKMVPGARIVVGHGQMPPHELEEVMLRFIRGEADVLVSTTIIESGIDIPTANTMVILDADRFGLSDLHQLRGRVGRSKDRGYCYLLLPETRAVKETAQKRLKALEQYSMLGAGFKIAMRDLEIRGAGNILGPEQSGHIALVGYEMYCQLLERAVHDLTQDPLPRPASGTSVELGVSACVPRSYVPSDKRRLAVYRRLASAATQEQLTQTWQDTLDAYGSPPEACVRLFRLVQLRIALAGLGVRNASVREKDVMFFCEDAKALAAAFVRHATGVGVGGRQDAVTLTPLPPEEPGGLDVLYMRPPAEAMEATKLLGLLRSRLRLAEFVVPGRAGDPGLRAPRAPAAQVMPGTLRPATDASASRRSPPRGVRAREPRGD
jgi:transcription-repair coupling factor (superfamily II helicase)